MPTPRPTPNLEGQGAVLSDPSPTNLPDIASPARSTTLPPIQLSGSKGYTSLPATRHSTKEGFVTTASEKYKFLVQKGKKKPNKKEMPQILHKT